MVISVLRLSFDALASASPTFLSISSDFTYLIEWDARGRVIWNWTAPRWLTTASISGTHMNHAQQTEGDVIFVSARDLSSVFKVDKQSSTIEWVLGGKKGDFDIIDEVRGLSMSISRVHSRVSRGS